MIVDRHSTTIFEGDNSTAPTRHAGRFFTINAVGLRAIIRLAADRVLTANKDRIHRGLLLFDDHAVAAIIDSSDLVFVECSAPDRDIVD